MDDRFGTSMAVLATAAFLHAGCYNTYFIQKDELEKLESGVEIKEVVTVQADCKGGGMASAEGDRPRYAQSDEGSQEGDNQATDAKKPASEGKEKSGTSGCTQVPVTTTNPIKIVETNGGMQRVTPFNFMMSEQQLVSPEYDYIANLEQIQGAKVREFSTWKTVGMVAGVSAVTIGAFVGISLTAEDPSF